MNTADYDKALFFITCSLWDDLLVLMVRTKDDMLSKRIEHFLHAYTFAGDLDIIEQKHRSLYQYVNNALLASDTSGTFEVTLT